VKDFHKIDVDIVFKGVKSSEALKDYVIKKINKLGKFFDAQVNAVMVLSIHNKKCEAQLRMTGPGFDAHADAVHDDHNLYSVVDEVVEKLSQQASKRNKKKLATRNKAS